MAKGKGDWHRLRLGNTEWLEAILAIALQNAAIAGQMLLRMLAAPETTPHIREPYPLRAPHGILA